MNENKYLSEIKAEGIHLGEKTNEELKVQIERIKKRAKNESLEQILPEWFALVQEVSFREIGLKHYDTQLLAGLMLHQGKIVEMKTGEGKTLASSLPVSLNALTKEGVHMVTVNDYLAERDQRWMGKIYRGLGLSVGLVTTNQGVEEKRENYECDITYVTNSELVFDYLRDSSAYLKNDLVQRKFNYCILDEIDSILIDEARTPLIISAVKGKMNNKKLERAKNIVTLLKKDIDFQIDEKKRDISLTEEGYRKVTNCLRKESLYDVTDPWILEILNALKAKYIFKINKDYIILNNKIVIVDEFTGRIMEDRRWNMGLHEAIEVKENIELGDQTQTKTSITYQNFFNLYPKLAGMTGTAKTAEKEFKDIYNLRVEVVQPAKTLIRKDLSDFVYYTELAKWKAILEQATECYSKGQPILIGTSNVEKSEFLSELFTESNIPHEVLNAKPENVFRESEIVALAGERFAVTIATNMAGRGTDIILGGNPTFKVKQKMQELLLEKTPLDNFSDLLLEEFDELIGKIYLEYEDKLEILEEQISGFPYSLEESSVSVQTFYQLLYTRIYKNWETENKFVKNIGGLFVLGTEHNETERIDNQLRGRAGRQGDPGISQFFVSLDDDLVKLFGGEKIQNIVNSLVFDEEKPIKFELLSKALSNAQKKLESYNSEIRKNVFDYDFVIDNQRRNFFSARRNLLFNKSYKDLFLRYLDVELDNRSFCKKILSKCNITLNQKYNYDTISNFNKLWTKYDKKEIIREKYQLSKFQINYTQDLLKVLDFEWAEHLERINYIRDTINWRSYGQQNPLVEYNSAAFESFKQMLRQIRETMLNYF